jgi:two-component system sensor histidine kinase VicK
MKMNNKPKNSLIFKVVVFHLLLFVILFILLEIFHTRTQLFQAFFIVLITSLIVSSFFTFDFSRSIKDLTHAIDRVTRSDFSQHSLAPSTAELAELDSKVNELRKYIQRSHNNLENQHNQLTGILAYMTDGVVASDERGNVILANTAALHLLNTTTEQILKKNIAQALYVANYFAFRDLLERQPDISIDSENSYGEYVRLRINFSVFRRESGEISGIIAVLHDVTEADKLEREQRTFVSNVSHELRTPLTTIRSYLETLHDGALKQPEIAQEFVDITLQETEHMTQMITDILDLSRMDMGRTPLQKEMVNVVAFLSHLVDRFRQVAVTDDNMPISFNTEFPAEAIWSEFDISKMSQVIDNILSNAVKYSPHGGVVTVKLQVTFTQLIIKISDQGIGIPAKDLSKVFNRFFRVDKARTHDAGGTGLGLAIAYDIVKLHDGTIGVKSVEGKGTEFAIVLPYTPLSYDDFDFEEDDSPEYIEKDEVQEYSELPENLLPEAEGTTHFVLPLIDQTPLDKELTDEFSQKVSLTKPDPQ